MIQSNVLFISRWAREEEEIISIISSKAIQLLNAACSQPDCDTTTKKQVQLINRV